MKQLNLSIIALFIASVTLAQNTSQDNAGEASTKYYAENFNYSEDASGKISSNIISYHENGKIEEYGTLVKGVKQGEWLKYDANGKKLNEGTFRNGKKDGEWKIWDNAGTLRMVMNYENGNRVGTWKIFDEAGILQQENNYDK